MYNLNFYLWFESLVTSFVLSNSFGKLFIKTISLWLILESVKHFETKASTIFNLDFANDNNLLGFFFFFLVTDLYFLVPAFVTQIFSPVEELLLSIRAPTKEAKAEMETHPVTIETNISAHYNSKLYKLFHASYLLNNFDLFL